MKKLKKRLLIFLFIFFFILFIISIIFILFWKKDSNKTKELENKVIEEVKINEVEDMENTQIIRQENIEEDNPYWSYIKMNLIDVDLESLKKINKDVVGWIEVAGTNVNYPFVKTDNNEYYLNHSIDKTKNQAGWVFQDYRNESKNNKNTILYAHGRYDNTMFGSLRNITTNGWANNIYNYTIRMSQKDENTLWQVFSIYRIKTTNDYIQTDFTTDDEFESWIIKMKDRSTHDFNIGVTKDDSVLTLSTCYNDYDKVVIHAKLIKREVK